MINCSEACSKFVNVSYLSAKKVEMENKILNKHDKVHFLLQIVLNEFKLTTIERANFLCIFEMWKMVLLGFQTIQVNYNSTIICLYKTLRSFKEVISFWLISVYNVYAESWLGVIKL